MAVDIDAPDLQGKTPLMEAAKMGHLHIVKMLLKVRLSIVKTKCKNNRNAESYAKGKDVKSFLKARLVRVEQAESSGIIAEYVDDEEENGESQDRIDNSNSNNQTTGVSTTTTTAASVLLAANPNHNLSGTTGSTTANISTGPETVLKTPTMHGSSDVSPSSYFGNNFYPEDVDKYGRLITPGGRKKELRKLRKDADGVDGSLADDRVSAKNGKKGGFKQAKGRTFAHR